MVTNKKRILFVDDDPSILAGIENLLYKDRKRWELVFASGGQRGLEEMRKAPFDVIVSDMRMPDVDGAALLNAIREESPATVRIMLSGYADRELIVRALPVIHQLVGKPCDAATLRHVISRSLSGIDVERDAKISRIVGQVDRLPSPPDIFFELTRLMQRATAGLNDVTAVVMRDPALSAKVLQLVSSAYFGTGQSTKSIAQAVAHLGTDQLRYIALTATVFAAPSDSSCDAVALAAMQRDAVRAAALAREFADPARRDEAFATALLHDVGQVVLALCYPEAFRTSAQRTALGEPQLAVELELFGVTHVDIGARLLAIWGLPSEIADGVQFHHDPGSAPEPIRWLASVVHVADAIATSAAAPPIDTASVERAGYAHLIVGWRDEAARQRG